MKLSDDLRQSVLQAAMEGKLTKQLKEDGNANDLLGLIEKEKAKLIKEKKIKKTKPLPEISEDDIPFDIPNNWKWTKLGKIATVLGGKRIPAGRKLTKENTGYKYIRVSDMTKNTVDVKKLMFVPKDIYPSISKYIIHKEDVYITVAGTIGKVGKIPSEIDGANLTENADRLVIKYIDQNYLIYVLQSPLIKEQIVSFTTKVAQPKLAIKSIQNFIIPLPPLAEQHRIVERVDALMAEIDELEKKENELEKLKKEFPEDMKASLLQAAMEGKLTEQLPEDGNADDLLEAINSEKAKLIKEKKIKKAKLLPEISEGEIPFDIPDNWKWVRLGNIVSLLIGKTPPRADPTRWGKDIPWISIADMKANSTINHTKEMISKESFNENFKSRLSPKGTLIMSFKLTIGRVSFLGMDAVHNEAIVSVFPIYDQNEFLKKYLFKILPYVSQNGDYNNAIKGKTLNSKSLERLLVPLPPLAEQHRIVEKLDELLPLCEELEEDDARG